MSRRLRAPRAGAAPSLPYPFPNSLREPPARDDVRGRASPPAGRPSTALPLAAVALAAASLAAAPLAACAGPDGGASALEVGSLEAYAREVQPHVAERCGSGGCHGRPERPLALYVQGSYRADPARTHLDEPLTAFELAENARRVAAFAHGARVRESELLCKPLPTALGGCAHGGGDVFSDFTDPACSALERWLASRAPLDGGRP